MHPTSTKELVSLIIPVYNRKETTLSCLQHLERCGDLQRYHVIVVDDGSTDGTAEAIKTLYLDVILLSGNGDLWWTGAMAKGMEYAYSHGSEYCIWLNDDCIPEPQVLSQLVEFMKAHPNTLAGPTCYAYESDALVRHHNGFIGKQGCSANPGEVLAVDGMSGWCVGIPASVFAKIGPPDVMKFPHYSGDDMYTFKATRNGFKAYLIGDLKVTLVGAVHDKLGFQSYFQAKRSAADTFQALFFSKKSPYRLPTKFFYFTERHGLLVGALLFLLKLTSWLGQWAWLQLAVWFKLTRQQPQQS
jgi:GT2 family glycosyltransferase